MKLWLTQLLSGKDNTSPEFARVMGAIACLTVTFTQLWGAVHGRENYLDYASAISMIIGAACVGARVKASTEPEPK